MTSSPTSSEISCPDFSKVLRDYKLRTTEQAQISGAKTFKKLFNNGLFRRAVRTEKDTLALIVNCGLAADIDSARQIVEYMITYPTAYREDFFCRKFNLEKLNSQGNISYRISTFLPPDGGW